MRTSLSAFISDTVGRPPIDACVNRLVELRDEGFRRVWMVQFAVFDSSAEGRARTRALLPQLDG